MNCLFSPIRPVTGLHLGDCRDVLRGIPDNSIDSIVTDPPYALVSIVKRFGGENAAPAKSNGASGVYARASAGFMGKQWDTGEVAFSEEFWQEVYRVLKPGGHVVSFGGTRTYHRMACAIEDAGFEIRDQLQWLYGCLDEKTEAVTPNGAKPYHKLKEGDLVLSYDVNHMSYQWQPIEEVYVYEIEDTVYRIATDYGEQIVSRNHRCIIERGGKETFQFAEEVAREQEIHIPVLESLSELLESVPDLHAGAGDSKQDLREGLYKCNDCTGCDECCETRKPSPRKVAGKLCCMRSGVLAQHETPEARQETGVQSRVQRSDSRRGMEGTRSQGASELDGRIETDSCDTDDGRNQSGLERWCDVQESQGELRLGEVREMSERIFADGEEGRLRDGTPTEGSSGNAQTANQNGMCSPHRPQPTEQRFNEFDVVCYEQRPQAVRAWRGHKTVVGRITPEKYRGVIWCVKVKSGAFVAVRNGFAFPTGNSGFPKSHDVSKAIDRAAGAEREVVGKAKGAGTKDPTSFGNGHNSEFDITRPATPEAEQWEGWGTALKPANEPICLARKPLSEKTVALNVLKWGTGALNIDACRIDGESVGVRNNNTSLGSSSGGIYGKAGAFTSTPHELGRFPANVITDGSVEMPNGAQRFFYSAKASKADRGEGNNHPTVKPTSLMQWLCRLVTPPGGVVLDPFMGSGSTGKAAHLEGFKFVGIEREEEYFEIAKRRVTEI